MKINELLPAVQDAYDDLQAKSAVREDAAQALDAATKARQAAAENLTKLQDELSAILGQLVPASNPRFRQG